MQFLRIQSINAYLTHALNSMPRHYPRSVLKRFSSLATQFSGNVYTSSYHVFVTGLRVNKLGFQNSTKTQRSANKVQREKT